PDGQMFGASNFSHRTSGSWVQRQWTGGVYLMAEELPEAGVWCTEWADLDAQRQKALASIRAGLRTVWDDDWYRRNMRWLDAYALAPWTPFFHQYLFPITRVAKGTWPVLARTRFDKNVNDEFLFVRRPAYYAALYTGRTAPAWARAPSRPLPYSGRWEKRDGVLVPGDGETAKNGWCPTQGLSLFWSPDYGTGVLGMNWNVYTASVVRADLRRGTVAWPDYWTSRCHYEPDAHRLTLEHQLWDLPVEVRRTYTFAEDAVRQQVRMAFRGDIAATRVVEQVPYLKKPGTVVRFRHAAGRSGLEAGVADAFWVGRAEGPGILFQFEKPRPTRLGVTSRNHNFDIGLVEVELGRRFRKGDTVAVAYEMIPMVRVPWTP
ncbi:MAG: hypothetical protein QHJ73_04795, partial [Armatimonadota bacterium]|nr:hypothetical protein [Armatimonadota bacterium]